MQSTRILLCVALICLTVQVHCDVITPLEKQTPKTTNSSSEYPRIINDIFKGTWLINESHYEFNEAIWAFEKNNGGIIFHITTERSNTSSTFDFILGFLEIRDGIFSTDSYLKYHLFGMYDWMNGKQVIVGIPADEEYYELEKHLQEQIQKNETFANALFYEREWQSFPKDQLEFECYLMINITLDPLTPEEVAVMNEIGEDFDPRTRKESDPLLHMQFELFSPPCHFQLLGEVSPLILAEYYDKALGYIVCVAICSLIQLLLMIKQIDKSGTQSAASKVSMATVGFQSVLDCFFSLFHLCIGVVFESVFNAFLSVAFFKFMAFSVFQIRYMLIIWKSRRTTTADSEQHWEIMRHQVTSLYSRLYIALVSLLTIAYIFPSTMRLVVLTIYSFWVPQIICNVTRETRFALSKSFVIGTSVTRSFIPLYFYACPENFFHIQPSVFFPVVLVTWQVIQITILFMQDRRGPRFFIPQRFLPQKYDYYRSVLLVEDPDCVICMNPVDTRFIDHMITPCGHVYHANCLEQWLDVKMECPTCRAPLPVP